MPFGKSGDTPRHAWTIFLWKTGRRHLLLFIILDIERRYKFICWTSNNKIIFIDFIMKTYNPITSAKCLFFCLKRRFINIYRPASARHKLSKIILDLCSDLCPRSTTLSVWVNFVISITQPFHMACGFIYAACRLAKLILIQLFIIKL